MKTYLDCKAKYKFRYIDYLRDTYIPNSNTDALQFGSYVHKIIELGVNATSLLELETLAKDLRKNYSFGGTKEKDMPKILKNFLALNEKLEETVSTEFPFEIDAPDDVKLNGIIDRVVKGKTGKYLVIDYKTSRRPSTKHELFKDPQMLMYA